jgi:hypothetical protein
MQKELDLDLRVRVTELQYEALKAVAWDQREAIQEGWQQEWVKN